MYNSAELAERLEKEPRMNTQTRKNPVLMIAALLSVLVLSSLACSLGGMTIGKDAIVVDVTLNEDNLNDLIQNSHVQVNSSDDVLFDKVTKVEMNDGFVRVFGTAENAAGDEVNGSYDVSFAAENDLLVVEIIAVDVEGVSLDDPRIQKANDEIAEGLTKSVTDSNGEVMYKEAEVKDGVLRLKVQVNINQK
jgi:hypothetical protein